MTTDWAKVKRVEPITRTVTYRKPERDCWHQTVEYEEPVYDRFHDRSYTGTVLGGIIGGAVGNAVGHGKKNKKVGAAVGAILGASIGNDISSQHHRHRGTERHHRRERRCDVTHRTHYEEEIVGYKVWYRYRGETYKTRMDYKPGKRIKVRVHVEPF